MRVYWLTTREVEARCGMPYAAISERFFGGVEFGGWYRPDVRTITLLTDRIVRDTQYPDVARRLAHHLMHEILHDVGLSHSDGMDEAISQALLWLDHVEPALP